MPDSELMRGLMTGLDGASYLKDVADRQAAYQQAQLAKQFSTGELLAPLRRHTRDPVQQDMLDALQQMLSSGDPEMTKQAIKSLGDYQNKTYETIQPTANTKDFEYLGKLGPQGASLATPSLYRDIIRRPPSVTNVNMGKGAPPAGYRYISNDPENYDVMPMKNGPADLRMKPYTEAEGKDLGFYNRMDKGHKLINAFEGKSNLSAEAMQDFIVGLPLGSVLAKISNSQLDAATQQSAQAAAMFVAGLNRHDSGSAITPEEWEIAKTSYIPTMNDTPEMLAQKRVAREGEVGSLYESSGKKMRDEYAAMYNEPQQSGSTYKDYKKSSGSRVAPLYKAQPVITDSKEVELNGKKIKIYKVDGVWSKEE